ncbi:MAG: YbaN family protein [Acidimicrobiia bacterium]
MQSTAQPVKKPRSLLIRGVYLVLGLICVFFAAISILPGIPTIDFVVLAAFFFARSSDRLHDWLVNHRYFGRMIGAYQGGLTTRMKWWAATAITVSLGVSAFVLIDNTVVRIILAAVWVYALWFVFSRPTKSIARGDDPPYIPPTG